MIPRETLEGLARDVMKSMGGRIYSPRRDRRYGHQLRPLWQRRTHAQKLRSALRQREGRTGR